HRRNEDGGGVAPAGVLAVLDGADLAVVDAELVPAAADEDGVGAGKVETPDRVPPTNWALTPGSAAAKTRGAATRRKTRDITRNSGARAGEFSDLFWV